MCGGLGRDIESSFMSTVMGEAPESRYHHRAGGERLHTDVNKFSEKYKNERMFDFVAGRNPRGLPNVSGATLKKPFVFGQYLKSRSKDVDRWIRIARVTAELQNP